MEYRVGGFAMESVRGTYCAEDGPLIPGTWFAGILALSSFLVFGLTLATGLTFQAVNYPFIAMASVMTILALVRYGLKDGKVASTSWLREFSEYCLLFVAISLLGVIASYPIAAASTGFKDPILAQVDELLHFNWIDWYAFVVRYSMLQHLGTVAYLTIYLSPAILLGHMAWHRRRAAARQFLLTFWLAAFLTLLLFPLFVAKGPLATQWSGPIPYMPISALHQSEIIPALRDRMLTDIDMGALYGLVCAPSFHTVCGILYIAAAWPIAGLKWPLLALNGAMLLATPVEGNHYLTDMLLGVTVALIAMSITRMLMKALGSVPADRVLVAA